MPSFLHEDKMGRTKGVLIAGIDEVGRGPLAGPVIAAAVIWPCATDHTALWQRIDDSKKLTAAKREILSEEIKATALWAIGEASVAEIDAINILNATFLAMRRALAALSVQPTHALIDGNRVPRDFPVAATAIVKGDSHSLSIAAASIVAKVHRDRLMAELAHAHPHYGWERNAGYGTATHMAGLAAHGATPHHRASFAPIAAILNKVA